MKIRERANINFQAEKMLDMDLEEAVGGRRPEPEVRGPEVAGAQAQHPDDAARGVDPGGGEVDEDDGEGEGLDDGARGREDGERFPR